MHRAVTKTHAVVGGVPPPRIRVKSGTDDTRGEGTPPTTSAKVDMMNRRDRKARRASPRLCSAPSAISAVKIQPTVPPETP
jgi:hypothetical protein